MTQAAAGSKGLRGVTATTSSISSIIGSTLTYRGIDVCSLAEHSTFEETTYLLWHGELPTSGELSLFADAISASMGLPPHVQDALRGSPSGALPIDVVRTAVSHLVMIPEWEGTGAVPGTLRGALRLVALLPTLVAALHRHRSGAELIRPRPELSIAANFLTMLHGELPDERAVHALDVALILHADHELNASTFAARVAASTLSDVASAVIAALCTLKGPLHGGANEAVMSMLRDIPRADDAGRYVKALVERQKRVMGFGHSVYAEGDPRAVWLKRLVQERAAEQDNLELVHVMEAVEQAVTTSTGLLPNIDFYSGALYASLGIPDDLFTVVFAMGRVAGWIAHIMEQYTNNRLIRPRAEYTGPGLRQYVEIGQR